MQTWTLATCDRCGADVIDAPRKFCGVETGTILLDIEPTSEGNHVLDGDHAEPIIVAEEGAEYYRPHSCPQRRSVADRMADQDLRLRRYVRVKSARARHCSACQARIFFGETAAGKFVPLEAGRTEPGHRWPPQWRLGIDGRLTQSGSSMSLALVEHRCST